MPIKDVAVLLASLEVDRAALDGAKRVAEASGAHLQCTQIGVMISATLTYGEMGMGSIYAQMIEDNQRYLDTTFAQIKAEIERDQYPVELRRFRVFSNDLASTAAMVARHADLVVARAPDPLSDQPHADIIEGALLAGGRPVLVMPRNWRARNIGSKAVLAWDASREATRALHDALQLLTSSASMTIITVDAEPRPEGHGDAPGLDIAAHVARHGVAVEVRNADSLGRPIAQVIRDAALHDGADLIVMGGYRHARIQQALFGGVTRSMLREPVAPLLISH